MPDGLLGKGRYRGSSRLCFSIMQNNANVAAMLKHNLSSLAGAGRVMATSACRGSSPETPTGRRSPRSACSSACPPPWPARVSMRISTGRVAGLAVLQRGDELETVAGHDAVVGVGRRHQRGRILRALLDVVIGRIGQQGLELLRRCPTSRSRRPRMRPAVNLWKRSMSMTPTAGRQAPNRSGRCVMTRRPAARRCCRPGWPACRAGCTCCAISHSAAAMKSSKTFCFLQLGAGLVPLLAVLAAAAQVRPGRRRRPSPATPRG